MERFERIIKLIGNDDFNKLRQTTVLVLGLGGVGGYTVEMLCRSGIGKLIIVDNDKFDQTNLNRQIGALDSTVGISKTKVMAERIKMINPSCEVISITKRVLGDNIDLLFKEKVDYIIDACDTVTTKIEVIKNCLLKNVKFISVMGMGNRFNSKDVKIMDLKDTINDPLSKIIRKKIKELNINKKIIVVASNELPVKTDNLVIGSIAIVPATAGILAANYVINDILNKK